MAQQHHDPADVLARHLRERATEFLRALRLHRGSATPEESAEAARALRRAARRISAGLYTFQPLLDPAWSQTLGPELAWVSGTLSQEDACATRLTRLLEALHRLSGPAVPTPPAARPPRRTAAPDAGPRGTSRAPGGPAASPAGSRRIRPSTAGRPRHLRTRPPLRTPPGAPRLPPHSPPRTAAEPRPAPGREAPLASPAKPRLHPTAGRQPPPGLAGNPGACPHPRRTGHPARPRRSRRRRPVRPRPRPAAGAQAPARAVRAAGARPAAARRAATVTATVPAPDDRRAADPRASGRAR